MTSKKTMSTRNVGNTALKIAPLGLGCASIGNLYKAISNDTASQVVNASLAAGYRYFDTAPHYGQGLSERRLGDVLRENQDIDYVLSSKVGRLLKPAGFASERHGFCSPMPFDIEYDYSYDGIMRSFEDSLQRLGLDRIDILYIHDIGEQTHGERNKVLFEIAMKGGYKALDELRSNGLISGFGLGVNEYQVCEAALEFGHWDCFLLAGRYTLLEQQASMPFMNKCLEIGSSVIIGGPYNSGILATGTKTDRLINYDYGVAPAHIIEHVKKIESVCDNFNIPLAAAALQFPLLHPAVVSVIPGLGNVERVHSTLDLFNLDIPQAFWNTLLESALLSEGVPVNADR